jgi:hypothetical protein
MPERESGVVGSNRVAVGSGVGEVSASVVGCAVGVISVVVGGMGVVVGGTAVGEGVNVDAGVGCIGPEQATNRKRMLITAWELIFTMITSPYSLQRKIRYFDFLGNKVFLLLC